MNIGMQCAGIIVLLLITYLYFRHPVMKGRRHQAFCLMLTSAYLLAVVDILSVVATAYSDYFTILMTRVLCKAYLMLLLITGFISLYYSVVDMHYHFTDVLQANISLTVLGVLEMFIIVLPMDITFTGNIMYTSGPACLVTYGAMMYYICSIIYYNVKVRKNSDPKKKAIVVLWMSMWVVAAVTQFVFPEILVATFAVCLGVLLVFCELENPDSLIDGNSGFYNYHALMDYLEDGVASDKDCSLMLLSFEPVHMEHLVEEQIDGCEEEINNIFRELKATVRVFKDVKREYVIVFENEKELINGYHQLVQSFDKGVLGGFFNDLIRLDPLYIIISSVKGVTRAEQIFEMMDYFKNNFQVYRKSNTIMVNEDYMVQKTQSAEVEKLIIDAIKHNRVEVFYQPIYSVDTGKFNMAEALVRIRQNDGSLIMPSVFIKVAEEKGLLAKLTTEVFRNVSALMARVDLREIGIEKIELNISASQLEDVRYVDACRKHVENMGVDPSMFSFGISQMDKCSSKSALVKNMEELRKLGVTFSMDDYGGENSNINHMTELPLSIIRLDRKLIKSYGANKKVEAVVKGFCNLAYDLNMSVVAQGAETVEDYHAMEVLGTNYVQGFFFSKPVDEESFIKFIKVSNRVEGK